LDGQPRGGLSASCLGGQMPTELDLLWYFWLVCCIQFAACTKSSVCLFVNALAAVKHSSVTSASDYCKHFFVHL